MQSWHPIVLIPLHQHNGLCKTLEFSLNQPAISLFSSTKAIVVYCGRGGGGVDCPCSPHKVLRIEMKENRPLLPAFQKWVFPFSL